MVTVNKNGIEIYHLQGTYLCRVWLDGSEYVKQVKSRREAERMTVNKILEA